MPAIRSPRSSGLEVLAFRTHDSGISSMLLSAAILGSIPFDSTTRRSPSTMTSAETAGTISFLAL